MRRMVVPLIPLLCSLIACASGHGGQTASSQLRFGVKAARMNLWREAQFRFERAARMDPTNASVRNNLAVAYEGSGDFEKAKETYAEALKLAPGNTYIQKNYSRFMEFYARNKKRELGLDTGPEPKPPGKTPPAKKQEGKPMTVPPPPTAPLEPGSPPILPDGLPPPPNGGGL